MSVDDSTRGRVTDTLRLEHVRGGLDQMHKKRTTNAFSIFVLLFESFHEFFDDVPFIYIHIESADVHKKRRDTLRQAVQEVWPDKSPELFVRRAYHNVSGAMERRIQCAKRYPPREILRVNHRGVAARGIRDDTSVNILIAWRRVFSVKASRSIPLTLRSPR